MDEYRERGLALFREVYGDASADGLKATVEKGEAWGIEQAEWTLDWTFGRIWSNGKMEPKIRSAAVIGMLIGMRAYDELRAHTRFGLYNGLTREDLDQIFSTAIPYAGFPAANIAKQAMTETFKEIDAENAAK